MKFQFPDTLPTDKAELAKLRADALDAFNKIFNADATPSEEDLTEMQHIVDGIAKIDAFADEQVAAEKRATAAAEMAAAVAEPKPEEEGEGEDAPESEPVDEPEDDNNAEDSTTDEDEGVTASGKTRFTTAAGKTSPQAPKATTGWRLTTSAQNFTDGVVDSLRVAREFGALAQGRAARVLGANGRSETTVAYLDRAIPHEFTASDEASAIDVLTRATDESRLPGGSLVAAGGWCAPSETVYDFLPTAAPSDLLSLPEIGVTRGGIKFPTEPDFSVLLSEIGFSQTEAQAQAGTEKPCYEIPCEDFTEVRLDAVGVCITSGILQDKAWPELTRKYVDEALRLHMHKLSARRIAAIEAGSTAVGPMTGVFGTAGAVLASLELAVADMRAKHRLGRNQSVEGMAPSWLLSILRADLAYRDEVLPQQVTDQNILDHFRSLGANLQFVVDWQSDIVGGTSPAVAWPGEVKVALWLAGTWWTAVEPVINLGITHDSTLLKTNRQIQLFTEDGVAIGKRGVDSRVITIPVKVDGMVGLRGPAATA